MDDVVIMAGNKLTMAPRVGLSFGQLAVHNAQGVAKVGAWFVGQANTQVIADVIEVRGGGYRPKPEFFDIFANQFDPGRLGVTVDDVLTTGPNSVPLPFLTYPSAPVVTPGVNDLVVHEKDGPVALPAGDYGRIRVGLRGTLIFEGGAQPYNIQSLQGSTESSILFATTTTLNVAGSVSIGGISVFGPQGGAVNPRCIAINIAGPRFRSSGLTQIEATISAPNADIRLGSLGVYTGSFVGNTVEVGFQSLLSAPPALTSACP